MFMIFISIHLFIIMQFYVCVPGTGSRRTHKVIGTCIKKGFELCRFFASKEKKMSSLLVSISNRTSPLLRQSLGHRATLTGQAGVPKHGISFAVGLGPASHQCMPAGGGGGGGGNRITRQETGKLKGK